MTTYGEALTAARSALRAGGCETAALDARLLLAAAAGLDMAALVANDRETLPALARSAFDANMTSRLGGVPVSRILGEREFWGLPFRVTAATLDPRPDTEALVAAVLDEARRRFPPDLSICDLGTGAGAIVMALLSELPRARGTATDISDAALTVAKHNAARLGLASRISFDRCDFSFGPEGPFDVVVSNPPYIRSDAIGSLPSAVRDHDPIVSLDGGFDGYAAYRAILPRVRDLLAPGGLLAFEVGHDQSPTVATLCREQGLTEVSVRPDLAGVGRVVLATRAASRKALKG